MAFSNPLSAPKPDGSSWMTAGTTLTLLLVLCLAPRAMMAWRADCVCSDGAVHLTKVRQLESGAAAAANEPFDVNVYPLVLRVFQGEVFDLETAARVWGVLAASLAVLPLFGWIRRAFDARIAVLACVLYAAHPKLIEWSPHAVHAPTFWLLFCLSLYFSWRAVTEVRPTWFAAAGVATFLAANTRPEGWLLLIPLVCWCGWRLGSLREGRLWLAGGVAAFALCYPLVLAVLASAHGYDRWEWTRVHRLETVTGWVESQWQGWQSPESGLEAKEASALPGPLTAKPVVKGKDHAGTPQAIALTLLDQWAKAYSPVYGLLMLLGLVRWWRIWLRRDNLPCFLLAGATFAAIWVLAGHGIEVSSRVFLPIVIVSLPCATLGLLPLCRWAAWLIGRLAPRRTVAPFAAATLTLAAVVCVGAADALSSTRDVAKRELGCWLHNHYGPDCVMAGTSNLVAAGYYAKAQYHPLPGSLNGVSSRRLRNEMMKRDPKVLLLPRGRFGQQRVAQLVQQAEAMGMAVVPPEKLPESCRRGVVVLVWPDASKRTAQTPRVLKSASWLQ